MPPKKKTAVEQRADSLEKKGKPKKKKGGKEKQPRKEEKGLFDKLIDKIAPADIKSESKPGAEEKAGELPQASEKDSPQLPRASENVAGTG